MPLLRRFACSLTDIALELLKSVFPLSSAYLFDERLKLSLKYKLSSEVWAYYIVIYFPSPAVPGPSAPLGLLVRALVWTGRTINKPESGLPRF